MYGFDKDNIPSSYKNARDWSDRGHACDYEPPPHYWTRERYRQEFGREFNPHDPPVHEIAWAELQTNN